MRVLRLRWQPGSRWLATFFALLFCCAAQASVSLLMEEPFGKFGAFNPTGHAALYLSGVCADAPTRLRLCQPGEIGVVISRYHRVSDYDWIAIPLIPYLYAVDDLYDVPESATPELEAELRNTYRREHLAEIAPDLPDGTAPPGEWVQLIGSSYDRKIYGFQLATTHEQDAMLVARLNDRHNKAHFNLFFSNCADFSRTVLKMLYPGVIPHNSPADFGLTTPKHLARSVRHVGLRHPELEYEAFIIPQIPGTIGRSHHVDGIAESLVRSKKYLVPLAFVSPTTAASLLAAYIGTGRFHPADDVPLMEELSPASANTLELDNGIAMPQPAAGAVAAACTQRKDEEVYPAWSAVQIARAGSVQ